MPSSFLLRPLADIATPNRLKNVDLPLSLQQRRRGYSYDRAASPVKVNAVSMRALSLKHHRYYPPPRLHRKAPYDCQMLERACFISELRYGRRRGTLSKNSPVSRFGEVRVLSPAPGGGSMPSERSGSKNMGRTDGLCGEQGGGRVEQCTAI